MAAVDCATQVLAFRPSCYEAYWARAKARKELDQLDAALADLRDAIKLSPKNMELHRFTMQVKAEIEAKPSVNLQMAGISESSKSSSTFRPYHHPMSLISSTPKKELESEV